MNADESSSLGLVPFESVLRVTFYLSLFILVSAVLLLAGNLARRRQTVGLAVLVALTAVIFHWVFTVCPHLVERVMNRSDLPLPEMYRELVTNSSSGFIAAADLHSDALMWLRRDLLTRSSVGHVDLPRLEQGHVRLQVFSIVVAVPRGMNLRSNVRPSTLNHDMLFPKMLLERWPLSSYKSHLQRALVQCDRLHRISSKSDGRLEVTLSAQQLQHEHATSGKEAPHITHAILALEGASALENNVRNIDTLFHAGLRILGPTHFFDTECTFRSSSSLGNSRSNRRSAPLLRRALLLTQQRLPHGF
jgi:membrane dipeptidase